MRTKLDILPVRDKEGHQNVLDHVALQQKKSKRYTDGKRGAKSQDFKPGDKVRVRKPFHVQKTDARFTTPLSVERQTGPSSFILSDGRRWNAERMSQCPSVQTPTNGSRDELEEMSSELRISKHPRNPPPWVKDFVM